MLFKVKNTLLLLVVFLLSACSPEAYQVNPTPNVAEKPNEVPESQQDGYMRIIADLRWDKMTSQKDWETRFPGCLVQKSYGEGLRIPQGIWVANDVELNFFASEEDLDIMRFTSNRKCGFSVGGLQFYLQGVSLQKDPTGRRQYRTEAVLVYLPREDQRRAFDALIREKYSDTLGRSVCSKYSCIFPNHRIVPTPYSTSILDGVKVDHSAF